MLIARTPESMLPPADPSAGPVIPGERPLETLSGQPIGTVRLQEKRTRAIDALIQFHDRGGATDADDLLWPTSVAIEVARRFVLAFHRSDVVFESVVSDGDGGISLEMRSLPYVRRIEIAGDGATRELLFVNSKLKSCRILETGRVR